MEEEKIEWEVEGGSKKRKKEKGGVAKNVPRTTKVLQ